MSDSVVFFGSGPVAAESLRLLAQDFEIEAVVTKPRPAHHKGPVPVIELAEKLKLPVLEASNKADLDALFETQPVKSQLAILIDFGIIVSQNVIDYFPLGIVNSHFSLLPEWRGADPITFSILSGQKETGVSLMLLVPKMDEGPLLGYSAYQLTANITTPRLTEDLIVLSHSLLKEIIPMYRSGAIDPSPQSMTGKTASYSRKLSKQDSVLDFTKPATVLEREIRAFAGWPRSRTVINTIEVIITKAHVEPGSGSPGDVTANDTKLSVQTIENRLVIDTLIPAGKNEMSAQAFLAGYKL